MKRILVVTGLVLSLVLPARANPYLIALGAQYGLQAASTAGQYGLPVLGAVGYGICHTPSIHIFGTEKVTVGLDWASFGSRSRNVYGLQMSLVGGGFAEDLYGVQLGIFSSGWVDGYDTSGCNMNGIQVAPFAVKTSMVNGFQVCPFYATAVMVNGFQTGGCCSVAGVVHGFQIGIANFADEVDGFQIGIYNSTKRGYCVQLGLINLVGRRNRRFLPVMNIGFR